MFPKNQRISSQEFLDVMKRGKNYHFPFFSLCLAVGYEKTCFAVVASKKVSKKAVIRNKNKRRLRHILKNLINMPFSGALILFIKKDLSSIPHAQVNEEVKSALLRMR